MLSSLFLATICLIQGEILKASCTSLYRMTLRVSTPPCHWSILWTLQLCYKIFQEHEARAKDKVDPDMFLGVPIMPPQTRLQDSIHIYCCLKKMRLFGMAKPYENKAVSPGWMKNYKRLQYKTTEKLELQTRARARALRTELPEIPDYKARIITRSQQIEILTISGKILNKTKW